MGYGLPQTNSQVLPVLSGYRETAPESHKKSSTKVHRCWPLEENHREAGECDGHTGLVKDLRYSGQSKHSSQHTLGFKSFEALKAIYDSVPTSRGPEQVRSLQCPDVFPPGEVWVNLPRLGNLPYCPPC